jgi:hypothetical protein
VEYWFENDQLLRRYANGLKLVMRLAGFKKEGGWLGLGSCPVRFIGDNGWVEAGDNSKIAYSDDALRRWQDARRDVRHRSRQARPRVPRLGQVAQADGLQLHVVRTTEVACHASAISWKLGRSLKFDPAREQFIDDDEANALCSYQGREGFTI